MRLEILLTIVFTMATIFVVAIVYGAFRWNVGTREMRARLEAARVPIRPQVVDASPVKAPQT